MIFDDHVLVKIFFSPEQYSLEARLLNKAMNSLFIESLGRDLAHKIFTNFCLEEIHDVLSSGGWIANALDDAFWKNKFLKDFSDYENILPPRCQIIKHHLERQIHRITPNL